MGGGSVGASGAVSEAVDAIGGGAGGEQKPRTKNHRVDCTCVLCRGGDAYRLQRAQKPTAHQPIRDYRGSIAFGGDWNPSTRRGELGAKDDVMDRTGLVAYGKLVFQPNPVYAGGTSPA